MSLPPFLCSPSFGIRFSYGQREIQNIIDHWLCSSHYVNFVCVVANDNVAGKGRH